jgi:hemin uptake protein HemP
MATLTGQTIASTYDGLLKLSDNDGLTASVKNIQDGLGVSSPVNISTAVLFIKPTSDTSSTPTSGKEFEVVGNALITGDLQVDNINIDGNTISATSGVVTLASGAIATTQSQNDNSTKIATTAYVDSAVDGVDTLAEILAIGNTTGSTKISVNNSSSGIDFVDNAKARFGTGNDLNIYHDSSNTIIENETGNLFLINKSDNMSMIFQNDDSTGGVETYFFLDGGNTSSNPITIFPDNSRLAFGGSQDLEIFHDGSNSRINETGTGNLIIQSTNFQLLKDDGGEFIMQGISDAEVALYFDGSKKFETTSAGVTITGDLLINTTGGYFEVDVSDNSIKHADNTKAKFGTGNDLEIYHDGSHSYIQDTGTGDLKLQASNDIFLLDGSGNVMIEASEGGSVDLFHNGSKKFETSSTGVTISNNLTLGSTSATGALSLPNNGEINLFNANDDNKFTIRNTGSALNTLSIELNDGTDALTIASDGDATFAGNISVPASSKILFDGASGHTYIEEESDSNLKFYVAGSERLNITNSSATFAGNVSLADSGRARFGAGGDFAIYHNGTDTFLDNSTGDLKIRNFSDDKDITFQSDDGLGGTATYFFLDGSEVRTTFNKEARFIDSAKLKLGDSGDLQIFHDGTDTHLENATGGINITNNANDSYISLATDNGSGGTTPYITLDGLNGRTNFDVDAQFSDNKKVRLGSSADLQLYHTGSESNILNLTGNLNISNDATDADIIFKSDDGSGGLAEYFRLDGGEVITKYFKDIKLLDNVNLLIGSGTDLQLYHTGSLSYIRNNTGNLEIRNQTSGTSDIILKSTTVNGLETFITLDGSATLTKFHKNTKHTDSVKATFGDSADLEIYHTGSASLIDNQISTLFIRQFADDEDIRFQCDDGSGGTTEYLRFDGSGVNIVVSKEMRFGDGVQAQFGASNHLQVQHNSSDGSITNATGNLTIQNNADDSDIIFRCDDGSGGTENYIQIDGSEGRTTFNKPIRINDSVELQVGSSADLKITHNGTNTEFNNYNGGVNFVQHQADGDIIFYADDGSGSATEYFRLDGGLGYNAASKHIQMTDGQAFYAGLGNDLGIFHNGTQSKIENLTGDLTIEQFADDSDIIFKSDNGSGGTAEYMRLDGGITSIVTSKDILMGVDGDGGKLKLGAGQDLQIYHDGSNSYVEQAGTGDLIIRNSTDDKDILLQTDNGSGLVTSYIQLDGSDVSTKILTQKVILSNLPTSDPNNAGQLFNESGFLRVSAG